MGWLFNDNESSEKLFGAECDVKKIAYWGAP
jgi:hypothetical protein